MEADVRRVAVGFGRMGHRDLLPRPRDWPLPMTFRDVRAIRSADGSRAYLGAEGQNLHGRPGRANKRDGGARHLRDVGAPDDAAAAASAWTPSPTRTSRREQRLLCPRRPPPLRQCCRPQLAVGPGSPSHSILVGGELASVCVPPSTGRPRPHFHIRQLSLGFLDRCPLTSPVPIASLPGLPAIADTTASSCPEASVPACASHARHTSTLASAATTAAPLRSATPWREALTGSDMSRKAARP